MLSKSLKAIMVFLTAVISQTAVAAEIVELPTEELAQESVLPIFDRPVSVKNRNIVTEGKVEADVFYAYSMTEPIANVSKFGVSVYYNTNEDNAWGFRFAKNFSGLSTYAEQLNQQFNLDFKRAPAPEMTGMVDYNIKAFYGKMSLSKSLVFNTMLFGSVAGGVIKYVHKTYPAVAFGLGQKFYFDKNWALRFDLRLYANEAPVPFLKNALRVPPSPSPDPVPEHNRFQDRLTLTTNLEFGLSYLF